MLVHNMYQPFTLIVFQQWLYVGLKLSRKFGMDLPAYNQQAATGDEQFFNK